MSRAIRYRPGHPKPVPIPVKTKANNTALPIPTPTVPAAPITKTTTKTTTSPSPHPTTEPPRPSTSPLSNLPSNKMTSVSSAKASKGDNRFTTLIINGEKICCEITVPTASGCRINVDMPKSMEATRAAGYVKPNEEEWKVTGRPLYRVYADFVYTGWIDSDSPYISNSYLVHHSIHVAPLDLTTGTTAMATGAKSHPLEPSPNLQRRDPHFIQPLDRSKIIAFREWYEKEIPNSEPTLEYVKPNSYHKNGCYPSINTWPAYERIDNGHCLIEALERYNHFWHLGDWQGDKPNRWANPVWEEADGWFDARENQNPLLWRVTRPALVTTTPNQLPHSTTFISDAKAWPTDGKITRAELITIVGTIDIIRNPEGYDDTDDDDDDFGEDDYDFEPDEDGDGDEEDEGDEEEEGDEDDGDSDDAENDDENSADHRYVPVTVVSTSGNLMRVLHAWHDKEKPFALEIRVSPVMQFEEPLHNDENWLKVCCFIMGDPIYPIAEGS